MWWWWWWLWLLEDKDPRGEVQACIYNGGGRRDQSTALTFCACVGMANLAGHGQDAETASGAAAAKIALLAPSISHLTSQM